MPNDESVAVTIIMGSARSDGNTAQAVNAFVSPLRSLTNIVNLKEAAICPFEYGRRDKPDDFKSIIGKMTMSDDIVFATPVYWYAMSGGMKIFFDRLTDILGDPIGRKLAGRRMWVLSTGTDETLPAGFHEPFERTAQYFGMHWKGIAYCRSQKGKPLSGEGLQPALELAARLQT